MKAKSLLIALTFFALFILLTLYGPVFANYHIERYQLGEGGRMSVFFGGFMIGVILLAGALFSMVDNSDR